MRIDSRSCRTIRSAAPAAALLLLCPVLTLIFTAAPAFAADADADTAAVAAEPDSAAVQPLSMADVIARAAAGEGRTEPETPGLPMVLSWKRTPKSTLKAEVRKILYSTSWSNEIALRDKSVISNNVSRSMDDYRQQEKTVEKRDGSLTYRTGADAPYQGNINMIWNWNEDRVTNRSGVVNLTKRDYKQATASLEKEGLTTGALEHSASVSGSINDQKGEMQGKRNDFSEGMLNGNVHSVFEPSDDLKLQTHAGAVTQTGDRALGEQTNPSSASGDTLQMSASYSRGRWTGSFLVSRSTFSKKYLDYNRNSNGIIDTNSVEEKIVQELETNNALSLDWNNDFWVGPLHLDTAVGRTLSENSYRASGVGVKENFQDNARVSAGYRFTDRDTLNLTYTYNRRWDDQTYKGATGTRGRQITKQRDLRADWQHQVFEHTSMRSTFKTGLSQSTAEKSFNQNDRDRVDVAVGSAINSNFSQGRSATLSFDYQRSEDISLLQARSGNNSIKETYEISPSYKIPLMPGFTLSQSFSVWIQFTDYVYSDLESINKTDNYNKRANMNTKITYSPNSRLTVSVRHDNNVKLNSSKSSTDVTGNAYYTKDTNQDISKINFSLNYDVNDWLKLEASTLKQRDMKETFGDRAKETERFSGDVAVGGTINRKLAGGGSLKLAVLKKYGHGPNVQPTAREYWDADIQVSWRF